MTTLALFDFDGTLTRKDTMLEFINFSVGLPAYFWGLFLCSPVLLTYSLGLIPNDQAKQYLLAHFFSGWDFIKFNALAEEYAKTQIDPIIRPNALKKLQWHIESGHRVVIVSASIENWLSAWCKVNACDLISTQLAFSEERCTGKFLTKNCHGEEKLRRIAQAVNLQEYQKIYAYGDSSGDIQMLSLAQYQYYKPWRN